MEEKYVDSRQVFAERLNDLMDEKGIVTSGLSKALKVTPQTIGGWKSGKSGLYLETAIKVADYFRCALDYLYGGSNIFEEVTPKNCPPFYPRLLQVMREKEITINDIDKDAAIRFTDAYFSMWKRAKRFYMETVIELAKYLNVSIDYLVGRE